MIRVLILNFIKVLVAFLILGGGVSGYLWLKNTAPKVDVKQLDEKVYTVDISEVLVRDFNPQSFAYGSILSSRNADLTFPIHGEVTFVSEDFKIGTFVSKGSLLSKLDDFNQKLNLSDLKIQLEMNNAQTNEMKDEIKSDKIQLKKFNEQLNIRDKQMDRISNMVKKKASTDSALDDIMLAVSNAQNLILVKKQNIVRLNHKLDQLKLSKERLLVSMTNAKKLIEDTSLLAPFDGSLTNVSVSIGDNIPSGKILGQLADLNSLEVSFTVPSEVYVKASSLIGREARVIWQQGSNEVSAVNALISRRGTIVNPQDGGGKLYAELPQVEGAFTSIPPGAFVRVEYPIGSLKNVILLPEEALYEGNAVYLVNNNRAEKKIVEVLYKEPGKIYLRGSIKNLDKVISSRLAGIGNGVKVMIRK